MNYKLFFFACALSLFYYVPNLLASPIIGSRQDTSHRYKYHVSIQENYDPNISNSARHFCGGSIIHDTYVLSAAHCFMIMDGERLATKRPRRNRIVVVSGTSETHGAGIITKVDKIFISHEYNTRFYADISVLKLEDSLNVAHNQNILEILPIDRRHHRLAFFVNKNALVLGNGLDTLVDEQEVGRSRRRQFLVVHMLPRGSCPVVFDYAICAVRLDSSRIGTCAPGDSGSPLVFQNTVIGVLSLVPIDYHSRDSMEFARISTSINFIQNAMDEHGDHSQMHKL